MRAIQDITEFQMQLCYCYMSVFYMQMRPQHSLDFDHSSGHNSFGPDTLVANRINVHPGGKQSKMDNTVMPNGSCSQW